jgi:hypothetical protein
MEPGSTAVQEPPITARAHTAIPRCVTKIVANLLVSGAELSMAAAQL